MYVVVGFLSEVDSVLRAYNLLKLLSSLKCSLNDFALKSLLASLDFLITSYC